MTEPAVVWSCSAVEAVLKHWNTGPVGDSQREDAEKTVGVMFDVIRTLIEAQPGLTKNQFDLISRADLLAIFPAASQQPDASEKQGQEHAPRADD